MSPTGRGKEYDAEALSTLIDEKGEKAAQDQVTEWLAGIMNPPLANEDGLIELLIEEDKMNEIRMIDAQCGADVLRDGLAAIQENPGFDGQLRSELRVAVSDLHDLRTSIFLTKIAVDEVTKAMTELTALIKKQKQIDELSASVEKLRQNMMSIRDIL